MARALVPGAIAGSTMEDVVLARAGYARLDLPENACRIRLNATALLVANTEAGGEVVCFRDGVLHKVAGGAVDFGLLQYGHPP
jgi:spermidine dehydrogenase